jgi:hypothetical protein
MQHTHCWHWANGVGGGGLKIWTYRRCILFHLPTGGNRCFWVVDGDRSIGVVGGATVGIGIEELLGELLFSAFCVG